MVRQPITVVSFTQPVRFHCNPDLYPTGDGPIGCFGGFYERIFEPGLYLDWEGLVLAQEVVSVCVLVWKWHLCFLAELEVVLH